MQSAEVHAAAEAQTVDTVLEVWPRALRQREAEQARGETPAGAGRVDPLDAEILVYVRAETAAGRRVPIGELAAMLGKSVVSENAIGRAITALGFREQEEHRRSILDQKRHGDGQVVCYLWSEAVFEALQRHFDRASMRGSATWRARSRAIAIKLACSL